MMTAIVILALTLLSIRWFRKRSKHRRYQDSKPSWSIGYALYFLIEGFTHSVSNKEALYYVAAASRNGLPNLNDMSSQSVLVGLKAYANTQGELNKLNNPLVVLALSEAVAVEARTALQMATAQSNIESYLKECKPDINDDDLQRTTRELSANIQKPALNEEGEFALYELLKHYLNRSFERRHGKSIYDFSYEALQKLAEHKA